MESVRLELVGPLREFAQQHQLIVAASLVVLAVVVSGLTLQSPPTSEDPPMMRETIPYLSNAYQFLMEMDKLLARAVKPLKDKKILGFYLGPKRFFWITGGENVQTLFRGSPHIGFEKLATMGYENMMLTTPEDIRKLEADKSGRAVVPLPGTEHVPKDKRYWATMHDIQHKYLASTHYANVQAKMYQAFFQQGTLEEFDRQGSENGGWKEMRLVPFMKTIMAEASIKALLGTRPLEVVPNVLELFWEYDKIVGTVIYGPRPKWLFRSVYAKRDSFFKELAKYFEKAMDEIDWDDPEVMKLDWEPVWGSRFNREFVGWLRTTDFSFETIVGIAGGLGHVALNANAIPISTWGVVEIAKDPILRQAIREEVEIAYITDPGSGDRQIDLQKLITLPRLQSFYIELLRRHVSINVTREITKPGWKIAGYAVPAGSIVQAPSEIAHYDETIWGTKEHPASEFWAERHLKFVDSDQVDERTGLAKRDVKFEMTGRAADFFPYGGGVSICPGRHFAKQEIILTLAMFASRFDVEFVEWLNMDGTESGRPAMNDGKYVGAAGVPPDRDMKVRWRKIW